MSFFLRQALPLFEGLTARTGVAETCSPRESQEKGKGAHRRIAEGLPTASEEAVTIDVAAHIDDDAEELLPARGEVEVGCFARPLLSKASSATRAHSKSASARGRARLPNVLEPLPQLTAVRLGVRERLTISGKAENGGVGPLVAVLVERVEQLVKVAGAADDRMGY